MTDTYEGWIALRIEIGIEGEDALANFFHDAGAGSVLLDVRDEGHSLPPGLTRLEIHLSPTDHPRIASALTPFLDRLSIELPGAGTARIETFALPPVDWEAAFRLHHRPVAVGARLLVAPPWDIPEGAGREILVIEPGMAFGTGQHATTRGCLEEIEAALAERPVPNGLDVGTGSGLLAAAMARLGIPEVVATDLDPAVLPLARANLDANGAAGVRIVEGRADAVSGTFALVVANLLADIVIANAPALQARTAPTGRLVLSGLLETQIDAVLAAYPGWDCLRRRIEAPWATLVLERAD